jgi:hypothetical protein
MEMNEMYPKRFVATDDLKGRDVRVKIERVELVDLGDKTKPVLYFVGREKGLVCNATNGKTIAEAFGSNSDQWIGGEVILFATTVSGPNGLTQGIRLRAVPRAGATPNRAGGDPRPQPPLSEDLNDAIGF